MKVLMMLTMFGLFIVSCSTISNSRNSFTDKEMTFYGGVYNQNSWSDDLVFNRYSWYQDATMTNEIMLSEITESSPFAQWLGRDKHLLLDCNRLQILLIYSNSSSNSKNPFLLEEIKRNDLEINSVLDFEKEFQSHPNFKDWGLEQHKLYGLCKKSGSSPDIKITIPGYETKVIR